jgi:hypothetical protein
MQLWRGGCGNAEPVSPSQRPYRTTLLQRKSVTFNLKNVSGGQIDVGVSVERQADSGEWQFVQESVGTCQVFCV